MMNEMTAEEAVKILTYERDNDIFVTTEHRAKIHQALTMAIQALESQPQTIVMTKEEFERYLANEDLIVVKRKFLNEALEAQPMRDATEAERKSVKDYVESISKPTGVRFGIQPTSVKETIIKSALKYLIKKQIEEDGVGFAVDNDPDHDCCWDDVLAWLETQPCEDCISRQAVIDLTWDWESFKNITRRDGLDILKEMRTKVEDLSSVKPERPKGKWIFCYGNRGKDNVEKCSCCKSYWKEAVIYRYDTQEYLRLRLKYCPSCGAEMEAEK